MWLSIQFYLVLYTVFDSFKKINFKIIYGINSINIFWNQQDVFTNCQYTHSFRKIPLTYNLKYINNIFLLHTNSLQQPEYFHTSMVWVSNKFTPNVRHTHERRRAGAHNRLSPRPTRSTHWLTGIGVQKERLWRHGSKCPHRGAPGPLWPPPAASQRQVLIRYRLIGF